MRVLALQPYHGGSHRAWLEGLVEHSAHEYHVISQPGCHWKWRMRGAAIVLAERARNCGFDPQVVLTTDMLSLAEFQSIWGRDVPSVLYMHENQLAYPVENPDERDIHFAFTNITSCLAARWVAFNGTYNMESFLEGVIKLMAMMPDQRPTGLAERIAARSVVIPPGVDLSGMDDVAANGDDGPPIVVWNHRWEYDKRPERFFAALREVLHRGIEFRVAVLGESFEEHPDVFDEARGWLADRIVQFGYCDSRRQYVQWLKRASVSVSTADQENFGIAAVEAAYAGARPLWPDRLSYPGLIPDESEHLYTDQNDLVEKLCKLLTEPDEQSSFAGKLKRYDWSDVIGVYDDLLVSAAGGSATGQQS